MKHLPLPISIKTLLRGKSVEWERIEYKEGWNPAAVLHTICAFANDFHNLGGGYIVIGVAEKDGRPVLPPKGIPPKDLDKIQKELLNLERSAIKPAYNPIVALHEIEGKHILVIWVPGGEARPYKCKKSLAKGKSEWKYYIRRHSSTVQATEPEKKELREISSTVPFDDRRNREASLDDLSRRLIEEFLKSVGSDLSAEAAGMSIEELGRRMNIIGGPPESPLPKNVGLMFFNERPDKFFPVTQIDVVWFPDGPGGDVFEEKEFKGPLDRITRDALSHIERRYLVETVIKHPDRAEAERFWNYPYAALEEAVVNAVYHRSYEEREPIEIRISPEEIYVLSFPGADGSVQMRDLATGKAVSRRYRNRRIGEFLRELNLTEGRSTGMSKILRAVKRNGSPMPEFTTDEDRTHFLVRFPVHEKVLKSPGQEREDSAQLSAPVTVPAGHVGGHVAGETSRQVIELLFVFDKEAMRRADAQRKLGLASRGGFVQRYLRPALAEGLIEMTDPNSAKSPQQQYRITDKGRQVLKKRKSKAAK